MFIHSNTLVYHLLTFSACIDDPEPLKFGLSQTAMYFYGNIAYDYDYTGYAFAEEEGYKLAKVRI